MAAQPPPPKFDPFAAAGNYGTEEEAARVAALAVDPRQGLSGADINAPPTDNLQAAGTAAAAAPPPTSLQQFGRALGLGTREAVQGALALPGTAIDLASAPASLAGAAAGLPYKSSAQKTAEALTAIGLPEEQTSGEKIRGGLIEGGAGMLGSYGLGAGLKAPAVVGTIDALLPGAGRVSQGVARTLQANPLSQAVIGGVQGGTQGTLNAAGVNPYAAALLGIGAGGLTGMAMPNASTGFANASDRALAQTAREKYNIPIDPASLSPWLVNKVAGVTKMLPFTGAAKETQAAQVALDKAVGNTFGAKVGDAGLTPEVMTAARDATSGIYQNVAANSAPLLDVTTNRTLTGIRNNADLFGNEGAPVVRIIDNIREIASRNGGRIPSDWLVNMLGSKSPLSRGAAGSGAAKDYFSDVKEALHENLTRYASPEQKGMIEQANQNWKNMKTVEGLVATGDGHIDPAKLASTFARNKYQRVAYTGGDPQLAELADISNRFLKAPPSLASQVGHYGGGAAALVGEHVLEHGLSVDPATLASKAGWGAAALAGSPVVRALLRRGALDQPMPPTLPEIWGRGALSAPTGATMQFNPQLQRAQQFQQF